MLKEEVEQAYQAERVIELNSNQVDDMQTNLDLIAQRI